MKLKSLIFNLAFILLAAVSLSSCGYNDMVTKQEAVNTSWAQVENVYQRRADLIPNLVNVVQGYANHEQQTITAVIEARSKATQVKIDPSNMTAEQLKQFQGAQDNLSSTLSRLMMVTEAYPNLKANELFLNLQTQLEGTENRITVERQTFNTTVQDYNTFIKRFPNNFLSGWFGFQPRPYFEAKAGSDVAPKVEFGSAPAAPPVPTQPVAPVAAPTPTAVATPATPVAPTVQ
jgi:LemA protein